jgi:hypothetical protein
MLDRTPILAPPKDAVLSLEVQARMPAEQPEEPVQYKLLIRHFLERFFNNEMASADGDGKTRLVQVACAVGLPGFVMALYLYPAYHPPRGHRPYWSQVSDHYFFIAYSLVALGVVTVFEWDFFFPNLLDVFVLSILPIKDKRLFLARITSVAIFVAGFLFNANFLAPLVLPAVTDPPNLLRLLTAHLFAVALSGIFAAALVLTLQGILLAILGEHLFRKISLPLQGLSITALLTLLLLTPAVAAVLRQLMPLRSSALLYFPPFWFLGIYQRILEGPAVSPVFARLARIGYAATALAIALAVLAYPFAYWRRTRQLVEGSGKSDAHNWMFAPLNRAWNAVVLRHPIRRAICHYISQTLLRVSRYRIYLVMYGGLGVALIVASACRLNLAHGTIRFAFSPEGLHAAVPIVAFWTVAGLRTSFLSPTDRRGAWIFRIIQRRPGLDQLDAAKFWVFLWALILSMATIALSYAVAPTNFAGWKMDTTQALIAIGLPLLLTDIFFLRVTTIPFTNARARPTTHLAVVLAQYLGLFPILVFLTLGVEGWMESGLRKIAVAAVVLCAVHLGLRMIHRRLVADYSNQIDLDDDQEEFPQTLGLRY